MNPKRIKGPWTDGYTLDEHTVSSVFVGHDQYGHAQFDTTRSPLGEALYNLKYLQNAKDVATLATAAVQFVEEWGITVDAVVPMAATKHRKVQPVVEVAKRVARGLGVAFDDRALKRTKQAAELKGVMDAAERQRLLDGAFKVGEGSLAGRSVLLLDDLFRSGATLKTVAPLLKAPGGAGDVFVLALTRTRSKV